MVGAVVIVNDEMKVERRQRRIVEGSAARKVTDWNVDVMDHAVRTTPILFRS
jgi:hypothetical protein